MKLKCLQEAYEFYKHEKVNFYLKEIDMDDHEIQIKVNLLIMWCSLKHPYKDSEDVIKCIKNLFSDYCEMETVVDLFVCWLDRLTHIDTRLGLDIDILSHRGVPTRCNHCINLDMPRLTHATILRIIYKAHILFGVKGIRFGKETQRLEMLTRCFELTRRNDYFISRQVSDIIKGNGLRSFANNFLHREEVVVKKSDGKGEKDLIHYRMTLRSEMIYYNSLGYYDDLKMEV